MNKEPEWSEVISILIFGVMVCTCARVYYFYGTLQPIGTFFKYLIGGAGVAVALTFIIVGCLTLILKIGEQKTNIRAWGDKLDKRVGDLEKKTNKLANTINHVNHNMHIFNKDMRNLKAFDKGREIILQEARILAEKNKTKEMAGLS